MPNRPSLLQIDTTVNGAEAAPPGARILHVASGLDQQLGEVGPAASDVECVAPQFIGKLHVACDAPYVEKDIDRQQILRS